MKPLVLDAEVESFGETSKEKDGLLITTHHVRLSGVGGYEGDITGTLTLKTTNMEAHALQLEAMMCLRGSARITIESLQTSLDGFEPQAALDNDDGGDGV